MRVALALRLPGAAARDAAPVLDSLPFLKFATNEAIQRTEAYEYAQSLGAQACSPPSFQVGLGSGTLPGLGLVSAHRPQLLQVLFKETKR